MADLSEGAGRLAEDGDGIGLAFFDEGLEAVQRRVPLLGQALQVGVGVLEALGLEGPDALAALAAALHQPRFGQHFQVLGDGLARNLEAAAQAREGRGPAGAEAHQQAQAGRIPQRREERRRVLEPRGGEGFRLRHGAGC